MARQRAVAVSEAEPTPDFRDAEVHFGRAVRVRRTERLWSQQDLADRMAAAGYPMHQTTVAKLESAERPLRVAEAAMLASLFDVPLADMLGVAAGRDPVSRARLRVAEAERRFMAVRLEVLDLEQDLVEAQARVAGLAESVNQVTRWREAALDELHAARVGLVEAEMEEQRG